MGNTAEIVGDALVRADALVPLPARRIRYLPLARSRPGGRLRTRGPPYRRENYVALGCQPAPHNTGYPVHSPMFIGASHDCSRTGRKKRVWGATRRYDTGFRHADLHFASGSQPDADGQSMARPPLDPRMDGVRRPRRDGWLWCWLGVVVLLFGGDLRYPRWHRAWRRRAPASRSSFA